MPDGGERENSTWSARAEGRRDETRVRLGASETAMARSGMRESTAREKRNEYERTEPFTRQRGEEARSERKTKSSDVVEDG
ncbi:hypothetical protein ALC60_08085 [Trachymyrmex zeteki]|uniref:Uncharacterized protein n=1 Tax=Mycetomoellerius zeteki TaxID=64791 RepID=A0A151WYD2_9HYME|nr:hypothetical protein ALC60_08085 [Trachymyrmex zeteki]